MVMGQKCDAAAEFTSVATTTSSFFGTNQKHSCAREGVPAAQAARLSGNGMIAGRACNREASKRKHTADHTDGSMSGSPGMDGHNQPSAAPPQCNFIAMTEKRPRHAGETPLNACSNNAAPSSASCWINAAPSKRPRLGTPAPIDATGLDCVEDIRAALFEGLEEGPRSPRLPSGVVDIDHVAGGAETPEFAAFPYIREYHVYLREVEEKHLPRPDYLAAVQRNRITANMRSILVDWLVGATCEMEVMQSTLYQCIDLVDRSLSSFAIDKDDLQLLGCACLLVACKYEETMVQSLDTFVWMAADSFTKAQLLEMETKLLGALRFRTHNVNTYAFLNRYTQAAGLSHKETALVHYLSELTLMHYHFLGFPPSMRAAAAVYLARATMTCASSPSAIWTPTLQHYTTYSAKDLERCVRLLHRAHVYEEWTPFTALRTKFHDSRTLHVADVTALQEQELVFAL